MEERNDAVTLRLSGERAAQGIELLDLERFLGHLVGALRGFDRVRRARPAVKGGRPERREEGIAAFRVVGLQPGSTVLTLEPVPAQEGDDEALFDEGPDLALENMHSLAQQIVDDRGLDNDVADALEQARSSVGPEEGAIEIAFPERLAAPVLTLDRDRIERARTPRAVIEEVTRISGRLHLIDLEPDRIGVRSPRGIDWTCEFGASQEASVKQLIDQIVIVEGRGRQRTSRSGSMEITSIRPALAYDQPALFSAEFVEPRELLEFQAIAGPQGLAALGDADWEDDEESDRFLDYVLGRS